MQIVLKHGVCYKVFMKIGPKEESKMSCPLCKGKASWKNNPYRPFCSERCRLIDLGRWAEGSYVIQKTDKKGFGIGE